MYYVVLFRNQLENRDDSEINENHEEVLPRGEIRSTSEYLSVVCQATDDQCDPQTNHQIRYVQPLHKSNYINPFERKTLHLYSRKLRVPTFNI